MTRRRKCMQQGSKQIPSEPVPCHSNQQKLLSRRQRRRLRRRLRRRQQRRTRSISMTSQIAADALELLHITSELNTKPFEFIQRYELTRQHAFQMSINQRPIVFFTTDNNSSMLLTTTDELCNNMHEDYYSSDV